MIFVMPGNVKWEEIIQLYQLFWSPNVAKIGNDTLW